VAITTTVAGPAAAYRAVQYWLFAPQPVHALVLGRILFGCVLFLCYLVRLPDAFALYAADGLGGPSFIQQLVPSDTLFQAVYDAMGLSLPGPSHAALAVVYGATLLCSLAFAAGYKTRVTGTIAWLLQLYFFKLRLPLAYWGWPALMQGFMLYVLLSRAGHFYSVDAWLARRRSGEAAPSLAEWTAPAWPLRLLQVHLCAMYATVGWSRIDSLGWIEGHTVFAAVTMQLHSKLVIDWTPYKPILSAATWLVLFLEPSAPFLLWVPRIGMLIAYALLGMHAGLEALTNVGWWGFTVVPGLLSFLPRSHLEALVRRLPWIEPEAAE
jgi:hypothetical protein